MNHRILILLIALVLTALTCNPVSAAAVQLKYIGSIYTDAEGVPLRHPAGATIVGNTLLVADSGGKRILSYRGDNGQMTPDQVISVPKMFPLMVERADNDDLYVLDGKEQKVVILSPSGQVKGDLDISGRPDDKRIVVRSMRVMKNGSLLILDLFSGRVLQVDAAGQFQRQIAFPDEYAAMTDLAVDGQGTIYILDGSAGTVYTAAPDADRFTLWSGGLKEYTNFPASLAVTPQGDVVLVDKHGSGLAIIGAGGSFSGRRLSMGWKDGQLYYPNQISINDNGHIFIADTENHRIQQFNIEQ